MQQDISKALLIPCVLTVVQRKLIMRSGLGDHERSVRTAHTIPIITALAFQIQEGVRMDKEFVIGEMLKLAVNCD